MTMMSDEATRQTQRVWEADLTEAGRRLSLDELAALEAMHQCQTLQAMVKHLTYMTLVLQSLEGRFDRLERYLQTVDPRYPSTADTPSLAALEARAS